MCMKEQNGKNYDCYEILNISQRKGLIFLKINDDEIALTPSSYANYFLYPNKKLSKEEYLELVEEGKLVKAKKYLSNILNKNRYTVFEIKQKLQNKFHLNENDIEGLLNEYIESNILDDLSYALDYIENGQSKGYSFQFLSYKLKQKGISDEVLNQENILKLKNDDLNSLFELIVKLNKKYGDISLKKRKEKIADYCLQRGYSYEQVKLKSEEFYSSNLFDYEVDFKKEQILLNKKLIECYNSLKDKGYSKYDLKNKMISKLIYKGFNYSDIIQEIEKEKLIND